MDALINGIKISGIVSCVPQNVEDNYSFSGLLGERRVKKQVRLTGVQKRHTSVKHQRPSDLCMHAANTLIERLDWDKNSIGILVLVTQQGDYVIPATAIALQDRMGLSKDCVAFDINLGCSAFNFGIHTVASILQTAINTSRALCLIADGVESLSSKKEFDAETISFSMLSGSAGVAIALEKAEDKQILFGGICDGSNFDAIIKRRSECDTVMKGNKVFDFAINEVSDEVIAFKKRHDILEDDIDFYVFHQAQKLILDSIADACSIPEEKMLFSLSEYGNTSGASLPLTLCANNHLLAKKDNVKLLLCGFGVGLSCGITYLEIDTANILSIEESDNHFDADKKPDKKLRDCRILVLNADRMVESYISKMLDDETAALILCGSDVIKLHELQKKIFWPSEIIAYDSEEELIYKLSKLEGTLQGVVCDDCVSETILGNIVIDDYASIVVLTQQEQNIADFDFSSLCMEEKKGIRINQVVYEKNKMDIVLDNWAACYLERNLPIKMLIPNYLGNSVVWLLCKESKYISGSVIRINEDKC